MPYRFEIAIASQKRDDERIVRAADRRVDRAGGYDVRGEEKWYVDFDRCIPYFAETKGCAICIARCPWSRPGIADNLLVKMARRRERRASAG